MGALGAIPIILAAAAFGLGASIAPKGQGITYGLLAVGLGFGAMVVYSNMPHAGTGSSIPMALK